METDCNKTWKRGFPPIISATMAPRDQMSIGVEYLAQPSRISGALRRYVHKTGIRAWLVRQWYQRKRGKSKDDMLRWGAQAKSMVVKYDGKLGQNLVDHLYHKVTTSWVYTLTGTPKARASPKSAILITCARHGSEQICTCLMKIVARLDLSFSGINEPTSPTPSLSINKLAGFRSLCIIRRWWQKSRPWKKNSTYLLKTDVISFLVYNLITKVEIGNQTLDHLEQLVRVAFDQSGVHLALSGDEIK